MARIKSLWGPRNIRVTRPIISWCFSGVTEDGEFHEWRLIYDSLSRSFTCRRATSKQSKARGERLLQKDLFLVPSLISGEAEEGRIKDILRSKLKPEELARCALMSMTKGTY